MCSQWFWLWHDFWCQTGWFEYLCKCLEFHAQQALELTRNDAKNKKTPSERQFCRWQCLVDERGEWRMARLVCADWKAMVTQITTLYNCGEQKIISHAQHVEPWGGCATTAEDHVGFHFCQPRTGCSGHRLTKNGQLKTRKCSLVWCISISIEASEFGTNSINPWAQLALCEQFRLVAVV